MAYNRTLQHFTSSQELASLWVSSQSYLLNQLVLNNDVIYRATIAHTSSASFATDLSAGRWVAISAPVATWNQQTPSGLINGSNVTFTLAATPSQALSLNLSLNGLVLRQGAGLDYTISGNTITMSTAPATGQTLWAIYTT